MQVNNNYVYFHKTPAGDIFYVGIGYGDRCREKDSRNKYWHNTVAKHGGYTIELVHENLSLDEARQLEIKYIAEFGRKKYDPNGILVNLALGGQGNKGYRPEYLMIAVTAIDFTGKIVGRWQCIEDTGKDGYSKQCVRMCIKGKKKSHKGFIWVETIHEKCPALISCLIASANNFKRRSLEFRAKMKEKTTTNYNAGINTTMHPRKRVAAYLATGGYLGTFDSTVECGRVLGVTSRRLSAVARGEKGSHLGMKFKYI